MFFSIIIPTYERVDLLERTISSVKKQTYNNYEIIIIDDFSDDSYEKLLQKNPDVIFQKNNSKGVGSARNLGAEKAKGGYLIFLDDDDVIKKDFLENVNALLNKYHDVDWIIFNSIEKGMALEGKSKFEKASNNFWQNLIGKDYPSTELIKKNIFPFLLQYQFFLMSSHAINRKTFKKIKFHNYFSRIKGEDFHYVARLVHNFHNGVICNKIASIINKHDGNFSKNSLLLNIGEYIILDNLCNDENFKEYKSNIRKKINEQKRFMFYDLFKEGHYTIFCKLFFFKSLFYFDMKNIIKYFYALLHQANSKNYKLNKDLQYYVDLIKEIEKRN